MDYWEVRAGCMIRHHLTPPFPASQLDNVRVTVIYDTNGRCTQQTDDGTCTTTSCDSSWTGVTVFQIKGHVRKEYAMYVKEPPVGARQTGKITKQRHAKAFKKDKNNLTERAMTPEERAQVWTFETTKEAEPSRTLTSRTLLKWSKNPDGTPRTKRVAHRPGIHGPRCLGRHCTYLCGVIMTHVDDTLGCGSGIPHATTPSSPSSRPRSTSESGRRELTAPTCRIVAVISTSSLKLVATRSSRTLTRRK